MHFNWIFNDNQTSPKTKELSVELEYQLRPRITKFLLSRFENDECCDDFNCFHFDVDMTTQWVKISDKTPKEHIEKISQREFDKEINGAQRHLSIA